jgi:predicted dehydrogenase
MSNGKIRVGIVGYGKMGIIRQEVVVARPDMQLVGVSDVRPPREDLPPGCAYFEDYQELIDQVDAVFVCTPNRFAPEVTIRALERGKHVFCEKPPGRTVDDVKAIIAAERANPSTRLKFGFNHRYHGAIMEALALATSKRFGKILWLRGIYGKAGGPGFTEGWRSNREMAGGGILLDQGIHMIDLFRLFCGDFDEVKSFVTNSYWPIELEDNAFAIMRNARGQVGMLHSSATQWKHTFSLEIYLEKGYLAVSGILSSTRSYGQGEKLIVARNPRNPETAALGNPREELIYFDKDLSWSLEIEEFAGCIKTGSPVGTGSSHDALRAMELVYAIYDADEDWRKPKKPRGARKQRVT